MPTPNIDPVIANPGAGGSSFATAKDDNGGNLWPLSAVAYVASALGGSPPTFTMQYVTATTGLPVNVLNASLAVTGTFWQATQPVSGTVAVSNFPASFLAVQSGVWTVGLSAGSAVIGHVIVDSGTITAVTAITNALPAGTNVIGHVIADTGSTTAVTGNVTVVQATGTNLHAVLDAGSAVIGHVIADSGSTTAVTGNVTVVQATGTNLHAVLDAGAAVIGHVIADSGSTTAVTGNVTVVQATGTNLHAVIDAGTAVIGHVITDTGSTTAVTGNVTVVQATGTNLHAVIDSGTITVGNATLAVTQSGTWNIGTVTTVTAVTAITNALPAGTNLLGYANEQDPAATTGTISARDTATTSATNNNGQTIITGTPTANSSVSCTLSAHSGITIQLKGTAVTTGTFSFERSVDGGTTWVPFSVELVGVGQSATSWVIIDNNAAIFRGNAGEMTQVRVRASGAYFVATSFAVTMQPGFGISQAVAVQGPPGSNSYPWPVTLTPQTTGGFSVYSALSPYPAAAWAVGVKNSAGQLYGLEVGNNNANPVWLRLYDETGTPVATDTPKMRFLIPGNSSGVSLVKSWDNGIAFASGIGFRMTTGSADNDAGIIAGSQCTLNIEYK